MFSDKGAPVCGLFFGVSGKKVSNGRGRGLFGGGSGGWKERRERSSQDQSSSITQNSPEKQSRVYIQKEIYYKELAPIVMETDKSQDLLLAI